MDVVYFSIIPTFEPSRYCKCWIVCFFYKFEFSGNAFKTIAFYRNDSNGNGVYDENDEYECNETICTFEEWTSSAEGYFSIDKNGDVQILHMMEWKDYNESKKR